MARAPNGPASVEVRRLEDALALLVRAESIARMLGTRMIQRARTRDEADAVRDLGEIRVAIESARCVLAGFHPNRIKEAQ